MGDFGIATEAARITSTSLRFRFSPKILTAATFEFCNTIGHTQTYAGDDGTAVRRSAPGAVPHDEAYQVAHVELQIPDDVLDDVADRDHAHDLARVLALADGENRGQPSLPCSPPADRPA